MSKPLLSVCLITYNQARFIKEAIDSILMQETTFAWELVIADDYSTDGTREIVQEYKKQFPDRIHLILQKQNVGAEKNWHELIRYPKTKYIAYLEGDDYWTSPKKLQLQVDFLEKHPTYSLCFHPAKVFFEKGEQQQATWPKLVDKTKLTGSLLLKENFIPSNSVMYRRQSYDHIPGGIMPGDWYLHLYHAQFGKIGYIDEVLSAYRRHAGGAWWNSHKDPDALWAKHGLAMLTLQHELMKLYGDKATDRETVHESMVAIVTKLADVDKRRGSNLVGEALQQFPQEMKYVIYSQADRLQVGRSVLQKEQERAEELANEILGLRTDVFHLRDELHTLKNARLLGRIIKARDYAGAVRKVPRQALHHVRVIGAPFVPAPARRSVKRLYRMARSRQSLAKPVTYREVNNKSWPKNLPLVSVVVPYYNRADTIDDTIASLMVQTFQNFEVLVVDDGSTDQTSVQKLRKLDKGSLKLKTIHQDNQGVAIARNMGVSQAKGKYIICLDSDDVLELTFIEKATTLLEANPGIALATTYRNDFGVLNDPVLVVPYDPLDLYVNNMVITAAEFRREAWEVTGGYKSGIGYEDWEFWLSLSEHGYWGRLIPETLFRYRTSLQSRFMDDKDVHWDTVKSIRSIHPTYRQRVRRLLVERRGVQLISRPETALINMDQRTYFPDESSGKPKVLITIPWMTFGGAETLIYNYCRQIKDDFYITFMTGLKSEHEWEYKFKEITPYLYHLANLFDDERHYLEFISNYVLTRDIDILHIIHNGFTFTMLKELKKRHPHLKVVVTMFNDRVAYFEQSIQHKSYIDRFVTDNSSVANHYRKELIIDVPVSVISNGLNCYDEFNPDLFDRAAQREGLGIENSDMAVFFVGRLSEEKNPDVFLDVAEDIIVNKQAKGVKFFVIGSGPMDAEIIGRIKKLDSRSLQYLGYQSKVAGYLSAADVLVLPSSIEGFPLSILEAMAMKLAVVASDVGAVAEVVETGRDGFIVPAGSAAEIIERVMQLRIDTKLLESMKQNARQDVEARYSNVILGDNYRKLYKEAME